MCKNVLKSTIVLFLFFLSMYLTLGCQPAGLKISLSLDKTTYKISENIHYVIKLKNNNSPTQINIQLIPLCSDSLPDQWQIHFLIYNENGQQLSPRRCPYVTWAMPSYRKLNHGGEFIFKDSDSYENPREFYSIHEPGEYTIQAIYHNIEGSTAVWKGEIKSNIVKFTINP